MTSKEKAKELYEKMYLHFRTKADSDICEQCALIAIEEILNAIKPFGNLLGKDYWEEVKQEIENYEQI